MNETLIRALDSLDEDIIECYFKTKESLAQKRSKARLKFYLQRLIPLAACLVLIFSSLFGVAIANIIKNQGNEPQNTDTNTNTSVDESLDSQGKFAGFSVSSELYEALSNAKDDNYLDIIVSSALTVSGDFEYQGKKYSQYSMEYSQSKLLLKKQEELLKDGELLKYGDTLYTTGTPDGIKWPEKRYNEALEYYGDLLDTYIVNGEFLRDKLQDDGVATKEKMDTLYAIMQEASNAYAIYFAQANLQLFKDAGAEASIKEDKINLHITKKQLSKLSIENKESFLLGLAQ